MHTDIELLACACLKSKQLGPATDFLAADCEDARIPLIDISERDIEEIHIFEKIRGFRFLKTEFHI